MAVQQELWGSETSKAVENFPVSGERVDERRRQRPAGDREVLHRTLGLRPPQRVPRHLDLAHRVVLDPEFHVITHTCRVRRSASSPTTNRQTVENEPWYT